MIIEDAADLVVLTTELVRLRRAQKHGESLAHRRQRVDALLVKVLTAVAACDALAKRLNDENTHSPLFEQALTKTIEWQSSLDDDLAHALGGDLFQTFYDSVDKAVREFERRAVALWRRYAAQTTPDTSDEILAALASDPQARMTIMRINRNADIVRRLRDRPFPTISELKQFDTAVADLQDAWSTLDVAGLSEEIVSFLRAANSDRGAPITLLTQSVTQWLDQRGAGSSYVIRPADQ